MRFILPYLWRVVGTGEKDKMKKLRNTGKQKMEM